MSNQFLNAQEYANVMLLLLKNQLVFGRLVDGQFKDQVTDENGLTINVKRPPRFVDKKDGTANLAAQDIVTGTAPVAVNQYSKVHISVGDIEYIQSYNALMQNETMKSAASTLAHSVDLFLANQTLNFASWVAGVPAGSTSIAGNATDPTKPIRTASEAMGAHTRLMTNGVPNESISGVMSFGDGELVRGSLLSAYEPPDINRPALQRVRIPLISEIDWFATQQCPVFTTGTRVQGDGSTTGFQIAGASQNVNYRSVKGSAGTPGMTQTLNLTGASQANLTVVAGEVFTIQNVFSWDWRAQQQNDQLQQFTVLTGGTAAVTTGNLTVTITPPIIVQGTSDGVSTDANTAFATVNAAPANNAFVQFAGAPSTPLRVRSAFHKRAISLVSARLQMPFTGIASYAVDPDTGIAIRYWRGSDITTGAHIHRWDMMYGAAVLDQFLGTRICGT
jgi:hypothetical protein